MVADNDKQRYTLERVPNHNTNDDDAAQWQIRANQGHSIRTLVVDMQPILAPNEARCVVHGTFGRLWPSICTQGLLRMERNHVHFADGLPADLAAHLSAPAAAAAPVVSGIRRSCNLFIFIDLALALQGDYFQFIKRLLTCADMCRA